jgi:hypothetical protein
MTAPVRRRPGRPRKNPIEPIPETTEVAAPPTGEPEVAVERGDPPPSDPRDPRVGLECHTDATHVGFDDGSVYEANGGYLVKRAY